jgi:cell division transport system permease protein
MAPTSPQNSLFTAYLVHHLRVFIASLGHLSRAPVATLMTSAVIAIALALPSGMFVVIENLGGLSHSWDGSTQISLYLKKSVSTEQAQSLADRLRLHHDIDAIKLIDKAEGLKQFTASSGFGDALKYLDENPLPSVLIVQPHIDTAQPEKIGKLLRELQAEKQVDVAQLDMEWVKRLYTLLELAQRAVWIIASLLALAVLLIIGNTIRLDIENRRAEIEVSKLIGASNAFIRRPFLYTGLWYGLLGGILAWLLTSASLGLLDGPVERLSGLYGSSFSLSGLSFSHVLNLIALSCMLGLLGSWLAVGRHLSEIEPS